MAENLKEFQVRLRSDVAFRSAFLEDPVRAFEAAGLVLDDYTKKQLRNLVAQLTSKEKPVSGSSLSPSGYVEIMLAHKY